MNTALSARLREGTKDSHTKAERTAFIRQFFKGTVEKRAYGKFVVSLYHIYSALEGELDRHRGHPVLSKVDFPELRRRASLEQDLAFYLGPSWRTRAAASPATEAYVQRIREVSATSPELLVAHCYTRYLGDLSGGQILKKIAQRAMSLPSDAGVRFYEFNGIPDEGAFKAAYRQRLDALPVDDAMEGRIVEEANTVFHLNIAVLEELGRDLSASGSTSLDMRM